jgi:hypothetical protein
VPRRSNCWFGARWSKWSLGDALQAFGKVTSGFGALVNELMEIELRTITQILQL